MEKKKGTFSKPQVDGSFENKNEAGFEQGRNVALDNLKSFNTYMDRNMPILAGTVVNGVKLGLWKGGMKLKQIGHNRLETRLERGVRGIDLDYVKKTTASDVDVATKEEQVAEATYNLFEEVIQKDADWLEEIKDQYIVGKNEALKIVDTMDGTVMKQGARMALGISESFADWSTYPIMSATKAFTAFTGTSMALGAVGGKAYEYGVYGTVATAQYNQEKQMIYGEKATDEELGQAFLTSIATKGIIDLAGFGIGKLYDGFNKTQSMNNTMPNDAPYALPTNERALAIIGRDNVVGKAGQTSVDLFYNKPLTKAEYNPALDPRNPRASMMDTIFDRNLPSDGQTIFIKDIKGNPQALSISQNAKIVQAKFDLEKGFIDRNTYASIVSNEMSALNDGYRGQTFVDNNKGAILVPKSGGANPKDPKVTIDRPEPVVNDTIENTVIPKADSEIRTPFLGEKTKGFGEELQPQFAEDNVITSNKFQETLTKASNREFLVGSVAKLFESDTGRTHVFTKTNSDTVTIMSWDKDNIKNTRIDPKLASYKEINLQTVIDSVKVQEYRVADNKIVDVQGSKKIGAYLNSIQEEALDKVVKSAVLAGDGIQSDLSKKHMETGARSKDIKLNVSGSATVFEMAQQEWNKKEGVRKSIVASVDTLFHRSLGNVYGSQLEAVEDMQPNALAKSFVSTKVQPTAFFPDSKRKEEKTTGWQTVMDRLVSMNARDLSLKKSINVIDTDLAIKTSNDVISTYPNIFTTGATGNLEFSNAPNSLFGKYGEENVVLDFFLNPNKVSIGADSADTIGDMPLMKEFNLKSYDEVEKLILSQYDLDEISAMAVNKTYTDPDHLRMLSDYGMISTNDKGNSSVTMESFVTGMVDIIRDYQNPDLDVDKGLYKEVIDKFTAKGILPNKVFIEPNKGTIEADISLFDFFTTGKLDATFSVKEYNELTTPTMIELSDRLGNYILDLDLRKKQALYSNITANKKSRDEAKDIVNQMINGIKRASDPNKYILGSVFNKKKERLLEIGGTLNQDLNNLIKTNDIEGIKGVEYTGKINDPAVLKGIMNQMATSVDTDLNILKPLVQETIGVVDRIKNGRDLKKFITSKKFNANLQSIFDKASKLSNPVDLSPVNALLDMDFTQYDVKQKKDLVGLLSSLETILTDYRDSLATAKPLVDTVNGKLSSSKNAKISIQSKSFNTAYEALKPYLAGYMGTGGISLSQDDPTAYTAQDVDSYIVEIKGETGKDINKDDILYTLRNQLSDLEDYLGDLPLDRVAEIDRGYDGLRKTFEKLMDRMERNIGNSFNFFNKFDAEKVKKTLIDYNKQAGNPFSESELLDTEIFSFFKNLHDSLKKSKAYNPINNFKQNDFTRFNRVSSVQDFDFQRLGMAINKDQWLGDRAMYISDEVTSAEVESDTKVNIVHNIALHMDELSDLTNLPEDVFETYVDVTMRGRMEALHSETAHLFKPVVLEVDADGNPTKTATLDINQFTAVYWKFLEDLNATRDIARGISRFLGDKEKHIADLIPYFNTKEDLFEFFLKDIPQRTGYVKSNAEMLDLIREKASNSLAEYTTYGSTQTGFGYMLKNKDSSKIKSALLRNSHKGKTKDGQEVDIKRTIDLYNTILLDVGDKLIANAIPKSDYMVDKKFISTDIFKMANNIISFIKAPIMYGVGASELFMKNYHTLKRIHGIDTSGRTSYGNWVTRIAGLIGASAEGAYNVFRYSPRIFGDNVISAWNGLVALDKTLGVEKAIQKLFGKEVDLSIGIERGHFTKQKMLKDVAKVTGDQHTLYMALKSFDQTQAVADKARKDGMTEAHKALYTYYTEANTTQEIASKFAFIYSYGHATAEFKGIIGKDFNKLSGETQSILRRSGITPENFNEYRSFVKDKLMNSKGDLQYDMLSLHGIAKDVDFMDSKFVDATLSIFTTYHNKGFEENRYLKFAKKDGLGVLMNNIYGAFKNVVFGVGMDDILQLGLSMDEFGVMRTRLSGNRSYGNIASQIGRGLGGLMAGGLAMMIAGLFAPILNTVLKDRKNTVREVARTYGDLRSLSEIVAMPVNERMRHIHTIDEIFKIAYNRISPNIAWAVYFADGSNIFDNVIETAKLIGRDINLALTTGGLDPDITNKILPNVTYQDVNDTTFQRACYNLTLSVMSSMPLYFFKGELEKLKDERRNIPDLEAKRMAKGFTMDGEIDQADIYSLEAIQSFTDLRNGISIQMGQSIPYEELSKEDRALKSLTSYQAYVDKVQEDKAVEMGLLGQLKSGINDLLYNHDYLTESEYIKNAVELYDDMGVNEYFDKLPRHAKTIYEDIIASNDDYDDKEKMELKMFIMEERNAGKNFDEIITKFAKNPTELINKYSGKKKSDRVKSERKKVEQFDNLPNLYKALYKEIRKNGKEISQDEMIRMYNEKVSISQIRSTYF